MHVAEVGVQANQSSNEALPQTDETYAEDGALIAIANDRCTRSLRRIERS